MISGRKSLVLSKKLLMLTAAHFAIAPIAFAPVALPRPEVLELQGLDLPKSLRVLAPQEELVPDEDAPGIWEVVERPEVAFARNAHNPMVSPTGTINPNFADLQGSMLNINDLSYLVAKSQSKKDELEVLRSKLDEVKTKISKIEEDQYDLDLEDCYSKRDRIEVKIIKLKKDLKENDTRKDALQQEFEGNGWILKVFKGKTGYKPQFGGDGGSYVDDDRGVVAYDPNTRTFVVCYHGSRNDNDWKTNCDGKKIKASEAGLSLGDIEVHRGFAFAAASCTASICNAVTEIMNGCVNADGLNFYFTGHSQGAGVAALGMADLAIRLGKDLYGDDFNNTQSNLFKGLLLSAPRAVATVSLDAYHAIVGANNVVRQNVYLDPVPNVSLREAGAFKTVAQVSGTIVGGVNMVVRPVVAVGSFVDNYAGIFTATGKTVAFADRSVMAVAKVANCAPVRAVLSFIPGAPTAWTLYQYTRSAFNVANTVSTAAQDPRLAGVRDAFTQEAGAAVDSVTGYAGVGTLALDPTAQVEKRAIWSSFKAWAGRVATNTVGLFKTRTRFDGQPASVDALVVHSVADLVITIAAPLHYGSTVNNAGGSFDPKIVGTDMDAMLANGRAHKAAPKKGWFTRAKEKLFG